ncbi:hypothetical protein TWF718_003412 [Orbilia javanica]|uniref:Uncharacterized protein n=1 Tax=Orbilia javanica TaxID=47235 RepID=A0AAN8RJ16_9PEZI
MVLGQGVTVCEPFVQELMRWAGLPKPEKQGPADSLRAFRFPKQVYFTQPSVREISFILSTLHDVQVPWPPGAANATTTDYAHWDQNSKTLRYHSDDGIKCMRVADIIQEALRILEGSDIIGITIIVPGCKESSDGLPVWIDCDSLEEEDELSDQEGGA